MRFSQAGLSCFMSFINSENVYCLVHDLSNPGIELVFPVSPAVAGRFFITEPPGKPNSFSTPR